MTKVNFYFDYRSPYSYLALTQIADLEIEFQPFDILDVMTRVGNSPTTLISKAKGDYVSIDIGRWVKRYGVPFHPNPRMNQIDARLLLRVTLAIDEGPNRRKAVFALFDAMWAKPARLESLVDILELLMSAGVADVHVLASRCDDAESETALNAASEAAASRGVFGAPTFFVGSQMFFGNDRLSFLRDALNEQPAATSIPQFAKSQVNSPQLSFMEKSR